MTSRPALERETWQAPRAVVLERNDRRGEACEALQMSFIRVKALRCLMPAPITMRVWRQR